MNFQKELLNTVSVDKLNSEAVIIYLQFPLGTFQNSKVVDALFDLDDIFRTVVETSGIGVYDGNEFGEGANEESVSFYFYGPDANRMYQELEVILDFLPDLQGSYIIKRYSSDNPDKRVAL